MFNFVKFVMGLFDVCICFGCCVYEMMLVIWIRNFGCGVGVEVSILCGCICVVYVVFVINGFCLLFCCNWLFMVFVYDYVLVMELLIFVQCKSLGWEKRQGVIDLNSCFYYLCLLKDVDGNDCLLFGGYDVIYYFGKWIVFEYDVSEFIFEWLVVYLGVLFFQFEGV